eukprot:TRINITY_DN45298_c0_g1_i1.p1 TRINITY_DN45298_c0_g1~~TRINITY_DN45298_c0_g1_i1.p1  ORF type:complete len:278 (-),score=43.18 TRINITY_DN45298_c0_g1_i1:154-987(-)
MMLLQLGLSGLAVLCTVGAVGLPSSDSINVEVGHAGVEVKQHAVAGSLMRSEATQRQDQDAATTTASTTSSWTTPLPVWNSCPIICLGCSKVGTGATVSTADLAAAREGMKAFQAGYSLISGNLKCSNANRIGWQSTRDMAACFKACLEKTGCSAFSIDTSSPWCVLCKSAEMSAHQRHNPGDGKHTVSAYKMNYVVQALVSELPWEASMEQRCNSECEGSTDADRTHCFWDNSTSPGSCKIATDADARCPPLSTTTTTPKPHAWFNAKFQRMKKRR